MERSEHHVMGIVIAAGRAEWSGPAAQLNFLQALVVNPRAQPMARMSFDDRQFALIFAPEGWVVCNEGLLGPPHVWTAVRHRIVPIWAWELLKLPGSGAFKPSTLLEHFSHYPEDRAYVLAYASVVRSCMSIAAGAINITTTIKHLMSSRKTNTSPKGSQLAFDFVFEDEADARGISWVKSRDYYRGRR